MPDIQHLFGNDFTVGPTGDIATSSGPQLGLERVLRRLLTNPGEYIFQLAYGAGLPAALGQVANAPRIQAVIRAQMLQEAAVARAPAPVISVTSDGVGNTYAYVRYADAASGQTMTLPPLAVSAP